MEKIWEKNKFTNGVRERDNQPKSKVYKYKIFRGHCSAWNVICNKRGKLLFLAQRIRILFFKFAI